MMENIKLKFRKTFDPIVDLLYAYKITPNMITVLGLIMTFIGAIFLSELDRPFRWFLTLIFLVPAALCDMLDGQLARKIGKESISGAFLDSVVDRIEEGLVYGALLYYYIINQDLSMIWVIIGAWIFSYMVSYTRARAEALGVELKSGLFERPIRVVVLLVGIFLYPVLLSLSLWIVFIGAFITAVQRFFVGMKRLNSNNKKEDD